MFSETKYRQFGSKCFGTSLFLKFFQTIVVFTDSKSTGNFVLLMQLCIAKLRSFFSQASTNHLRLFEMLFSPNSTPGIRSIYTSAFKGKEVIKSYHQIIFIPHFLGMVGIYIQKLHRLCSVSLHDELPLPVYRLLYFSKLITFSQIP